MNVITSDYKRTEQNGDPHSNLSLVMAHYSLATDYYKQREFAIW